MALSVLGSASGGDISTSVINWMKSIFGSAFTVSRGYSEQHDGVDLPAPIGTPVYALKSGIVSYAENAAADPDCLKNWACGGGNVVNVDIGGNFTTQFAHLNTILVKQGQKVFAGQQIGTVGKTGYTIGGAHLHFGLWDKNINKQIDPSNFFAGLGDTLGFLDRLKSLGIPTNADHKITEAESFKLAQLYSDVFGIKPELVQSGLVGKTVGELNDAYLKGETTMIGGLNSLNIDVGAAIMDTVTWIGFIFVGIALIIGGILLIRPSGSKEE